MNIQDWFPLGLAALTSLQFKGLSRVFSKKRFDPLQKTTEKTEIDQKQ